MVDPGERVTVGCPLSTFFGLESMFWVILSCQSTVYCVAIVLVVCLCMFYISGDMGDVFVTTLSR